MEWIFISSNLKQVVIVGVNQIYLLYYLFLIKGTLDNILEFSFWLNFIYHVKMIANLQKQKGKFKNSF